MTLLQELNRLGVLRTLDDALANTLRRLDPSTPDDVLAAAALASLAVAQGHAAFDPARPHLLVGAGSGPDQVPSWPDAEAWRQALAASRFVVTPASPDAPADAAPLALENGLLYLRRYREYERRLALQLRRIASGPMPETGFEALAPLFATLFPDAPRSGSPAPLPLAGEGARRADEDALRADLPRRNPFPRAGEGEEAGNRQALAAALALRCALLLVTGGPGTGKTTTIARLLLLRLAQARAAGRAMPRIALAAPTGRAADRMAGSLRRVLQPLRETGAVDPALLDALPTAAHTLHRLLGTLPDAPDFRHRAGNPLPYDIVVVDEASMVDLPLMCKLTEAVAEGAQLVLLGDPDQLPSVEAGDVLAAILAAAGPGDAVLPEDAEVLRPLFGDSPGGRPGEGGERFSTARSAGHPAASPAIDDEGRRAPGSRPRGSVEQTQALRGHRIHLARGWRQDDTLHLAPLADAVRRGDAAETLALLRGGRLSNVHFHEGVVDPLQARPQLLDHWRALAAHADPARALAQADRLRLLTAVREGAQGARALNERIAAQLSGRRIGSPPTWFPGRLLLVTENSYRHHLFNGDVGLCLPDADGALLAWFPGNDGAAPGPAQAVRAFHPAALPAHDSAFAMTVHKAQGSEFDTVWLQLPARDNRVLSRELLYTAITRARGELHIAGSVATIAAALARHAGRMSGLGWRLGSEAG